MRKVWIAQLKCPENHCVIATAAEIPDGASNMLALTLEARFNELVEQGLLRRECGICKSQKLHVEVNRTIFDSMEQAAPALQESHRQQLATAEYLKASKN